MEIAGAMNDEGIMIIVKAPTSFRGTILLTKWFSSYECLTEHGGCGGQLWLQEQTTKETGTSYRFGHQSVDKDDLCKGMSYQAALPPEEYLKDLNKKDTSDVTSSKSLRAFLDWQQRVSDSHEIDEDSTDLFFFGEDSPTAAAQTATQQTVASAFAPPSTKLIRNIIRAPTGGLNVEAYSSYIQQQ